MSKQTLVLGAGCFWGVQYFFDQLHGILETEVGYSGGSVDNPTYEQVCYENTGHAEVCRVVFDDSLVGVEDVVKYFFMMHDPTQLNRQGPDVGNEYRSAIFYTNEEQVDAIRSAIRFIESKKSIKVVTEVAQLVVFWPAEDYHQKFTERTGRGACHIDPTEISLVS